MKFPRICQRTVLPGLAVLAVALLASCIRIPEPTFDPRAPGPSSKELVFQTVEPDAEISPDMLRPSDEPYRLGPGDILEIEIAEIPGTLAKTFVMPDGTVYYNLSDGVKAEGLTTQELADALAGQLKRDYSDPVVNVTLVEVQSRRYWLLGRVYSPGLYPLRQPTTLIEAISMGGGLFSSRFSGSTEELADLGNSIVIRDGEILPVDFTKLIRDGDMSQNIYLRPNDYIYLPSAQAQAVLLLGSVNQPKSVSFKDELTLAECIAYGLGPTPQAYMEKVVIVRGSLREPQVAVVNFYAIMTGQAPDVKLRPGDIVWVPDNPWEIAYDYVKTVIRSAAQAIAVNEGARAVGATSGTTVSIPLTTGSSSVAPSVQP